MKLIYYRHNKNLNYRAMGNNVTNFYEITLVLKGEMTYYINNVSFPLTSGDAVFLRPSSLRNRSEIISADYVSFNFLLEDDEVFSDLPNKMANVTDKTVKSIISAIDDIYEENFNHEDGRLKLLFETLVLHLRNKILVLNKSPIVAKAKYYIKNNIANKITLKDVAKYVNYSEIYCDSVFKKETGKSIIEYVIEERIRLAKGLLIDNMYKLSQIAKTCGFSDYNYFTRTFKKRTGYTPMQYKKLFIN